MVKQSPNNLRNHKLNSENLSKLVKSADSYEDELIKLLSEKRENRRALKVWEWELTRRNMSKFRDAV